ncbi:hypothetical protein [Moraxella nonliquefaciens]
MVKWSWMGKQAVLSRLIQNEQNAKDAMKKVEQGDTTQSIDINPNTPNQP